MPVYPLSPAGLQKAAALFSGAHETLIATALAGKMRGTSVYGSHPDDPAAVRAVAGDFSFFAGDPAAAGELISSCTVPLLAPAFPDGEGLWAPAFQAQFPELLTYNRYAFSRDPSCFDREALRRMAVPPEGFGLRPMDAGLFWRCLAEPWSRDFAVNFTDFAEFARHGLGFLILAADGQIVSGASTYTWYPGGIEIEVDTHPDFRRKGLARAASAALILAALEKGLFPSWDAANLLSVRLAESLGYRQMGEYHVWCNERRDPEGRTHSA